MIKVKGLLAWLILAVLMGLSGHVQAGSDPLAWQLSDGTRTVILLGSVHAGQAAFFPLPEAVERAFDAADALAVELDITRVDPAQYQRLIAELGLRRPGDSLPEAGLQAELAVFCQGEPAACPAGADLRRLRPWLLSLTLANQLIAQSDYHTDAGVDRYFIQRAGPRPVLELESLALQMQVFAGLSAPDEAALLRSAMADFAAGTASLDGLMQAWARGDAAALRALVLEPMAETPGLYEAIFNQRNRAMADSIVRLTTQASNLFVVVGAGHLIGPEGLLSLLRARGFSARQLSGQVCVEPTC